jgi:hypothetical protein
MRTPTYLSPTSIDLWSKSQEEFYLKYLADNRPPRDPQTKPMSVGSAFDAFCKADLHEKLFGKGKDPKFDLKAIFEAQVEEQNRTWAFENGFYIFDEYRKSGAYLDLLTELQAAKENPRFEFEVEGQVGGYRSGIEGKVGEVNFLGKPDCFYINRHGNHVVHDWKVNGYCSKGTTSPKPGYVRCRSSQPWVNRSSSAHPKAKLEIVDGITINTAHCLEDIDLSWGRQLAIYAWLCGETVGNRFVVSVDQVVAKETGGLPELRFAEHRCLISETFQIHQYNYANDLWEICRSDHIFRGNGQYTVSKKDSQEKCALLEQHNESLYGPNADPAFLEMTQKGRVW